MAGNQLPIFQAAPKTVGTTIADTDTTTLKTLYTAGADGGLIDNISVVSDDTSDAIVTVTVNDGSTDFPLGEVTILAGAGTDGTTPTKNLLDPIALPVLQLGGGLPLGPLAILKVNAKVTLTAGKTLTFVGMGGDY